LQGIHLTEPSSIKVTLRPLTFFSVSLSPADTVMAKQVINNKKVVFFGMTASSIFRSG
jgi:hypothetical protein